MTEPSTLTDSSGPPHVDPSIAASTKRRSPEHWIFLVFALLGLTVFLVLGFLTPDERGFGTHEKLGLPPCGMMELAGIPCPGCGVTTSVSLAANGRFLDSFVNQPFGFLFALASAAFIVWAIVSHFRGRDLFDTIQNLRMGRWSIGVVLVMLISWVYKIVQL